MSRLLEQYVPPVQDEEGAVTAYPITIKRGDADVFVTLENITNNDEVSFYVGSGNPNGVISAEAGSIYFDTDGKTWTNSDGATAWTNLGGAGSTTLQEAFDNGETITIADTDNQTLTINQNDVTNNPDALTIVNTGTGAGITLDCIGKAIEITAGDFNWSGGHAYTEEIDDGNSGATETIDWTTGNNHLSTLTDNVTYTFTPPSGPAHLTLRMVQDGGGTNTVTWPATVKWANGTEPVWTTTGADVNLAFFYYAVDGNYYGSGIVNAS